jgi:hypothetical protein
MRIKYIKYTRIHVFLNFELKMRICELCSQCSQTCLEMLLPVSPIILYQRSNVLQPYWNELQEQMINLQYTVNSVHRYFRWIHCTENLKQCFHSYYHTCNLVTLVVSVFAIEPKVCGFKPRWGYGFLRVIKFWNMPSFGREGKPLAPCHKTLRYVKDHF